MENTCPFLHQAIPEKEKTGGGGEGGKDIEFPGVLKKQQVEFPGVN